LFVTVREPDGASGAARGCVLVIPPFGEEMNKARRMVAEAAIRLAEQGIVTVIPDLYGTGDSGGDFVDADWETWRADLGCVAVWAEGRGMPVDRLLAVRLGAALALDCIASGSLSGRYRCTVFWQPVFDGVRFLTQFLRLRTAASLAGDKKESVAELRASLAAGQSVEVAGYVLSPGLASALGRLSMPEVLPAELGVVTSLEVTRSEDAAASMPLAHLCERSVAAGRSAVVHAVAGEPFWSSTEVVTVPGVIDSTCGSLLGSNQCPVVGAVHG
jgi:exosortase A-associated hydrolase 2